mmetsp:Transcript_19697/g.18762  ORF Transcript_19697/g.18762 Transcript_19697/m.18762 type:complete len:107 (+) Transcript_19697:153-473(+)
MKEEEFFMSRTNLNLKDKLDEGRYNRTPKDIFREIWSAKKEDSSDNIVDDGSEHASIFIEKYTQKCNLLEKIRSRISDEMDQFTGLDMVTNDQVKLFKDDTLEPYL